MSIQPGTHKLGPSNGTLRVKTGKTGAASKAGHNLVIEVTSWEATLVAAEDPAQTTIQLDADGGSLRVRDGSGGAKALSENDKKDIQKSIDKDVLKKKSVAFSSTSVAPTGDGQLAVQGDLTLVGTTKPVEFTLDVDDAGKLTGSASFNHCDWEIKQFSALFGALKVAEDVVVEIDATVPAG
ncbi:MAG: YceI family protein [Actinobacteria bacterium]|nr:YceI family protein [Actinomycetota bacterium]